MNTNHAESIESRTADRYLPYGGMLLSVEVVTPAMATIWLKQNVDNRRLRHSVVEQYARDMENDAWRIKPVAVCFDERGALGNGQHTLNAIIMSGVAQELLVARNVPRTSIAAMDVGLRRSMNDVAKFCGMEIDFRRSAIGRVLRWGPQDRTAKSFQELFEAYQQHARAIDFVCANSPKQKGTNSVVLAVCAKAAYTADRSKIVRFLEIMATGIVDGPHETSAIRLRELCRNNKMGANTGLIRCELYEKTTSALHHFLKGLPVTKLYGTSQDLFPTENGEQEQKAAP